MLNVNTYSDCYQVCNTNSSFIEDIHFFFTLDEDENVVDDEWGELVLRLDGAEYRYQDVPVFIFFALVNAESLGSYFNSRIKNLYRVITY